MTVTLLSSDSDSSDSDSSDTDSSDGESSDTENSYTDSSTLTAAHRRRLQLLGLHMYLV